MTEDYGVFTNKCIDALMGLYLTSKLEKILEKRSDLPLNDLTLTYNSTAKVCADEDFMRGVYRVPDFALL